MPSKGTISVISIVISDFLDFWFLLCWFPGFLISWISDFPDDQCTNEGYALILRILKTLKRRATKKGRFFAPSPASTQFKGR
jgi:hypothetical protein